MDLTTTCIRFEKQGTIVVWGSCQVGTSGRIDLGGSMPGFARRRDGLNLWSMHRKEKLHTSWSFSSLSAISPHVDIYSGVSMFSQDVMGTGVVSTEGVD
jgi:hypothetical protein